MKFNLNDSLGFVIHAKDGDLGKVSDFYFDSNSWTIRYLIIDTGNWLLERKVIISTVALNKPAWNLQKFTVNLTKEQIEKSPLIDTNQQITRQLEEDLHNYYGWPNYWGISPFNGINMVPIMPMEFHGINIMEETNNIEKHQNDPNLISINEITGYHIIAKDGETGHVEGFIADDENWKIKYIISNPRNWLPGKRNILFTQFVKNINQIESRIIINLMRNVINNSPKYDFKILIDKEFEENLESYYGNYLDLKTADLK